MRVAVLINNLGAMSDLEINIVVNETVQYLGKLFQCHNYWEEHDPCTGQWHIHPIVADNPLTLFFPNIFLPIDQKGVAIMRAYAGRYCTSQEMAGFSITLLNLSQDFMLEALGKLVAIKHSYYCLQLLSYITGY